jgi:isopenicillin-N epimerase
MKELKDLFLVDKDVTFLNFGSFGACPKPIFDKYQSLQCELENQPVQFFVKDGMVLLAEARKRLGEYINCHADNVVYVLNPSYAINTIAKSFPMESGDEILATDIEYGALDRTWDYYCSRKGAKYVQQHIPLPITSKGAFIEAFWKGYTENTKAIFISHITSATGLILPVEEICEEAKKRGLITIVDGAHVPGHIPLDLAELKADIYTGACHKWMMAPKGSSFLYATQEQQHWIDPLLISWGYKSDFPSHSQFLDYHQTAGTRDYSAFLTVPTCIEFMQEHNWAAVAKTNRRLVQSNVARFEELLSTQALAPVTDEFFGQLCSLPIKNDNPAVLHDMLLEEYKIEVPVFNENGQTYIRYSIQAFNSQKDLDILANALEDLIKKGMIQR